MFLKWSPRFYISGNAMPSVVPSSKKKKKDAVKKMDSSLPYNQAFQVTVYKYSTSYKLHKIHKMYNLLHIYVYVYILCIYMNKI